MWRILQQDDPDDYVLATGETHSVREFVELAFAHAGRTVEWRGNGLEETGVDAATGDVLVAIDPRYFRPTEVDLLLGDSSKAHQQLGWRHQTGFDELVRQMVDADMKTVALENHNDEF
jgi:GDPmannose 4,6-dehydratase